MSEKSLSELKAILEEWEGDALDIDYKTASGEIPKLDNADAKMKTELWFALHDAIKQIEKLPKWKRLAMYGLYIYKTTRVIYHDDAKSIMDRLKELEDWKQNGIFEFPELLVPKTPID